MSGGFPFLGGLSNPKTLSGPTFPTCTASGSTNTKGSYAQIAASTPADIAAIALSLIDNTAEAVTFLVDIAIGAGGSEKVIIPNILFARASGGAAVFGLLLPVTIPAGTRVAARCQCATASKSIEVGIVGYDGDFTQSAGISAWDDIGTATGTSTGTSVAPANGSKGSYAQLVASTANDYEGFIICPGHTVTGSSHLYVDVAVGAGGSEKIIASDIRIDDFTNDAAWGFFPIDIPKGSRIALRSQGQATTACPFAIYGAR